MFREHVMIIEPVIRILNQLEQDGWIGKYAIAGAMAVVYYTEPVVTYDLDIVTILPMSPAGLVDLSRLYAHMTADLGYKLDREHVLIGDVPVQFLPAYNALMEEALDNAVEIRMGSQTTSVLSYEHLLAIMIKTGRPKDISKIQMALDCKQPDSAKLDAILAIHGLSPAWKRLVGERK